MTETIKRQINCSFPGLYELGDRRRCETLKEKMIAWKDQDSLKIFCNCKRGAEARSTQGKKSPCKTTG